MAKRIVALILVVSACSPEPVSVPDGALMACSPDSPVRFDASLLEGPRFTPAEFEITTEAGRALRAYFRDVDAPPLYAEADGFTILSETVVLGYRDRTPTAVFFLEGDRVVDWAPCHPRLIVGARVAVRWHPLDSPDPDASTLPIAAEVERCVTSDGEDLLSPVAAIEVAEDAKTVTVVVWSEEPPRATCSPAGGTVQALVRLSRPLGDRLLLDGGTIPATPTGS